MRVAALGGRLAETVEDTSGPIEVLGPLTGGTLTSRGAILPAGSPNTVLVVARRAGRADVELVLGPKREQPEKIVVGISVEG